MSISKTDIINKFNSIFRAGLSPAAGTATSYYGFVPGSPSTTISYHADLGPRAEPPIGSAQIPTSAEKGVIMANSIFHVLHNLAMEYTRVRQAKWYYLNAASVFSEGTWTLTALHPNFALYFPLPSDSVPNPGTPVSVSDIDDLLEDLRDMVNERRTDSLKYGHHYGGSACHSSAPPTCHGSRGRR